jgi:hypothetical protein
MPRFKLVTLEEKSAMEQVFACASMATSVLLSSHAWYHLYGELRDELFDEVRDATVAHFITYKVKLHRYCRQTKDGRPLNFADNMLSSAFSVCGNVANTYLRRLTKITKTEDVEPFAYGLGPGDGFPLYVSDTEREKRYHQRKMNRVWDRAIAVRKEYENYLDEFREMQLTGEPLELGPWLVRNGYGNDDELFFYMESKPDRKKLLQGQARWLFEQRRDEAEADLDYVTRKQLEHSREYQREYARKRHEKERAEVDRKLREVLGDPPEGYQWFEMKSGKIGQRRIKK